MILINAAGALKTLLDLMVVPGVLLTASGAYMWFSGYRNQDENKTRLGRMLLMFGIILLVIIAILSNFLLYPLVHKTG